jgi:hypothetical protein
VLGSLSVELEAEPFARIHHYALHLIVGGLHNNLIIAPGALVSLAHNYLVRIFRSSSVN